MSSIKDPPAFFHDPSGYAEYKHNLLRWARLTKVDKKQRAEVVLYHLRGHSSGIQEKIDTALGDAVEDKEDGLQKLVEYLDTIYAEDEMTSAWTKYKQFVRLKKDHAQPVNEFIADFEKAYVEAREGGCEFSDIVLGFNLLESCNLSETDEKFILTAVDFKVGKQNKDLLKQIKNSLRKFQSREKLSCSKDDADLMHVKQEESFVSSVKQALIADGWKPPNAAGEPASRRVKQNSAFYKGKKNPLGPDGKPIKCYKCGSEYHLADVCEKAREMVDKSEGKFVKTKKKTSEATALSALLKKSKDTEFGMICRVFDESDEELVLVTQEEEELCFLVEEAGCRGVLDSACSKSVAGLTWIRKYTSSISATYADSLMLEPSSKVARYVDTPNYLRGFKDQNYN